jgi:hypothetical protein
MTDAERAVVGLAADEQRRLAYDLAHIVASYGQADPTVVDPLSFTKLLARLDVAFDDQREAGAALAADCGAFIDRFDEEPEGPGFYAFGAVVSLYYASCTLTGVPNGALNAVKRFLDLLGTAEDDGESGLYDDAISYLTAPSGVKRDSLVTNVAAHATSIAE